MLPNVNALLDDELVGSLQTGTLDKGDIIRRLAQTIPLGQVGRVSAFAGKIRSFRAITVSACRA